MNVGTASGQALELEVAVESVHAVGETVQARAARRIGTADTVVVDVDQHTFVQMNDAHADARGTSILRNVREHLRDKEVRGRLGRAREPLLRHLGKCYRDG